MNQLIVDEALSWASPVATPFRYGACVKGVGVDCAHLVKVSLEAAGASFPRGLMRYDRGNHFERMVTVLRTVCVEVSPSQIEGGDILCFNAPLIPNHMGIANGNGGMIHVYAGGIGKVTETPLQEPWLGFMKHVFRLQVQP